MSIVSAHIASLTHELSVVMLAHYDRPVDASRYGEQVLLLDLLVKRVVTLSCITATSGGYPFELFNHMLQVLVLRL